MVQRAVVLLSGGLDSTTCLAIAISEGFEPILVSFDYHQRHRLELEAAQKVAEHYKITKHFVFEIGALKTLGGSALTDDIAVPEARSLEDIGHGIPVTYVPARNLIFLSHAAAVGEVERAMDVFIGVNALDYSGYPDCRPEFIESFERTVNLGTKMGVEGRASSTVGIPRFRVHTPLIRMSKADIVRRGMALGAPLELTVSCYQPRQNGVSCGRCDSCLLRKKGFAEAGIDDPTSYEA
jgi:7-cyano-7-deazaguanine synthase